MRRRPSKSLLLQPLLGRLPHARRGHDGETAKRASGDRKVWSAPASLSRTRWFVSLQRTGRLGTYAWSLGQEAVAVGIASAMLPEDVLLPSYRDNAVLLWRGVTMEDILLFWGGDERGSRWSGPVHDFPFCIPVGSQAPHAAGVAYAFKYRKQARVAVCILGDGADLQGANLFAASHLVCITAVLIHVRFWR